MQPSAADLNATCQCVSTSAEILRPVTSEERPHLFAPVPVFVDDGDLDAIRRVVAAIDRISRLPAWAADLDLPDHGPSGALMGFDFHFGPDGPQLIEINTNAGGALLAARTLEALEGTCAPADPRSDVEPALLATFRAEWASQRGDLPLRTAAIVDREPAGQFLFPEFGLYRDLFERSGLAARIVDARDLALRDGRLWADDLPIDLVYNRTTDFALRSTPDLERAWREGLAVVTPNPRIHASLADKRRLIALSDRSALEALGADVDTAALVASHVPRTVSVTAARAAELWATRKAWFFKPATGFGSRAAYRGDKLTSGKWAEILSNPDDSYVAQRLVPPTERAVPAVGSLKFDVRAIAYRGRVQLFFARLYQGQTTNLRTPGGGFAAVLPAPEACGPACC
jgi:hypothetical protein